MIMLGIRVRPSNWRRVFAAAAAASILLAAAPGAMAQPNGSKGQPNALQGFSQNRNQPVQIEAGALEVRDKDKVATFSGNVKVVQGDTTMRSKALVVFYEQQGQQQPGTQAMNSHEPGLGFVVTSFRDSDRQRTHLERLLGAAGMRALHWFNFNRAVVECVTLQKQ